MDGSTQHRRRDRPDPARDCPDARASHNRAAPPPGTRTPADPVAIEICVGRRPDGWQGINYDTGFMPGNRSRPDFDPAVVAAEIRAIARELGCTAVRVTGADPGRISVAARAAAAVTGGVVLAVPGRSTGGRPDRPVPPLRGPCPGSSPRSHGCRNGSTASSPRLPAARGRFGGPLTYASGTWEPVDWSRFDSSASTRTGMRATPLVRTDLRKRFTPGKRVVATEFGCWAYAGAADRGGLGWDIAEYDEAGVPTITGEYQRDESEQVRYMQEVNQIFVEEGLDLAFWFTVAGYQIPASSDPHRDADLASYGLAPAAGGTRQRLPGPGLAAPAGIRDEGRAPSELTTAPSNARLRLTGVRRRAPGCADRDTWNHAHDPAGAGHWCPVAWSCCRGAETPASLRGLEGRAGVRGSNVAQHGPGPAPERLRRAAGESR